MKFQRFEDIIAWQESIDLGVHIYSAFDGLKDRGFYDQITRAVLSISNNISEGFDRRGDKEFHRFLKYARSSCSEVKYMTYFAKRLGYLSSTQFDCLIAENEKVSKLIWGLIKYLKNQ